MKLLLLCYRTGIPFHSQVLARLKLVRCNIIGSEATVALLPTRQTASLSSFRQAKTCTRGILPDEKFLSLLYRLLISLHSQVLDKLKLVRCNITGSEAAVALLPTRQTASLSSFRQAKTYTRGILPDEKLLSLYYRLGKLLHSQVLVH